ncbi:hypothetical protein M1D80_08045 [Phyllobacteriaceae bacterium JZ32]
MRPYGIALPIVGNQHFFADPALRIGGAAMPEDGRALAGLRPAREIRAMSRRKSQIVIGLRDQYIDL